MLASMFNLNDRLAELRPGEAELRLARQLRDASAASADDRAGRWSDGNRHGRVRFGGKPARVAVG